MSRVTGGATSAASAQADTIRELLEAGSAADVALRAPGREPLRYAALREHVDRTLGELNRLGFGREDRVALVLPNGPELAACFLALAAGATAAPLNPAFRSDEFAFTLSDLGARALVVERGSDSPAVEAAAELDIPVLELRADAREPAGSFELAPCGAGPAPGAPRAGGPGASDDVGLVLHTSGTTSRPKIVPLTQANLCASARHIRETLALGPGDCCLNVMPLFHIHGLVAAVLASLSAGGSVFCTPGFNALRFFAWLAEAEPTWYTAVPTMHQAVLARAERNAEVLAAARLRFVRSSSASLPPRVMAELEKTFRAPVVEAYAMTEAAHQMTSNPLPPRERRPGSVGVAAGPEVAVMDEAGKLLPAGQTGEIVIRGPNVTRGYERNPEANAACFKHGWFRTGDQGVLDADGYLTVTGRLKEIINRGGEKVSPREVDEVLLDHPDVEQAVTFALPHETLGEDVAAAIVLREGGGADERELRRFATERLAAFKVPRTIVLVDEIPKGATGKLQRIGLAEKLGLAG